MRGRPRRLHDVLRNLVANAVSYAPEHGTIRMMRPASRATAIGHRRCRTKGRAFPTDDLVRVFERFYRVDKSRARDPGGTGLGPRHREAPGGAARGTGARREPAAGGGAMFTVDAAGRRRPGAAVQYGAEQPPRAV